MEAQCPKLRTLKVTFLVNKLLSPRESELKISKANGQYYFQFEKRGKWSKMEHFEKLFGKEWQTFVKAG
jgi:hypothetical protein